MLFNSFSIFLCIAERGGIAAAARELGISPGKVSESLAALEARFGATLIVRTTRSISLTEEGRTLVEHARRLIADVDELECQLRHGANAVVGTIRFSMPEDLGRRVLLPIIDRFMKDYPGVAMDISLTDDLVDFVSQGMDFVVRHGVLPDSSLRARSLGTNRRIVCAAPSYLDLRGRPEHPRDLMNHDCIVMRFGNAIDRDWVFNINGVSKKIRVNGRRVVNDGALVRQWCRDGHGIALKSVHDVGDDLNSGALVELLKDYSAGTTGLQIVYGKGPAQPRRVRLLIDRIVKEFEAGSVDVASLAANEFD